MKLRRVRWVPVAVAVAVGLGWWFGGFREAFYGSSHDGRVPTAEPSPSPTAAPASPSTPSTFASTREIARGRALGVAWAITASSGSGPTCIIIQRPSSRHSKTCWPADRVSTEAPLRAAAPRGEFWFGPAPIAAADVWVTLSDGRTREGTIHHIPSASVGWGSVYLVDVPFPRASGTVVVVGTEGRFLTAAGTAAHRVIPLVRLYSDRLRPPS
ncbi:MAG TPA: hypothetical protein VE646_01560 [Actinomycetota bacterium]|nr:hypothetical protein [Actinomycetota bacterium]